MWLLKLSGILCIRLDIFNNFSFETAVAPFRVPNEAVVNPVQLPSSQSALFGLKDLAAINSLSKKFLKSICNFDTSSKLKIFSLINFF